MGMYCHVQSEGSWSVVVGKMWMIVDGNVCMDCIQPQEWLDVLQYQRRSCMTTEQGL